MLFSTTPQEVSMNQLFRKVLSFFLGITLLISVVLPISAQAAAPESSLKARWTAPKPVHTQIAAGQSSEVIELKFVEGSSYRLIDGRLGTLGTDDLQGIESVLQNYQVSVERLFTQPEAQISAEKLALEAASGEQMPDLNLWYRLNLGAGGDAAALIDELNALPQVEIAYPAPLPAPLPVIVGSGTQTSGLFGPVEPPSPSYVSRQGYLNPATAGIDAKYAWTQAGGKGENVILVDVEYSFNQTHEDLKYVPVIGGVMWNGYGDDHGTAVLGEMIGKSNFYGVTGIATNSVTKFSGACMNKNCANYNPANAINTARLNTGSGDVILVEQQFYVCNSEFGPPEWAQAIFDVIKTATTAGRIVVETAGNGGVDLDQPACNDLFNRSVRDSGAIIVGAGSPPTYAQTDRSRLDFSSYGSRVDVQGWGHNVCTTGYGDLYTGSGKNQWYTNSFGGTSSSAPIVAGAAALLSSIAQERGVAVTPDWIRSTLVNTGSPQQSDPDFPASEHIGPRPDLKAAIATVPVPGFNSQFTANASGWSAVKGTWTVDTRTGMYTTSGAPNSKLHSVKHVYDYTTLTYEVRMKRTVCASCGNFIVIRGTSISPDVTGLWENGYYFQYKNKASGSTQGAWSVIKVMAGVKTILVDWTPSAFIVPNGLNTLKVTAVGSDLWFYINGNLVWSGADPDLTTGQVGMGMAQGATTTTFGTLSVDWAKLGTSVTAPISTEDSAPAAEIVTK
jgi:hypothetical protein